MKVLFRHGSEIQLLNITLLLLMFVRLAKCQITSSESSYPRDCIASATEGNEKGIRSLRCKYFPDHMPPTVVYLSVKTDPKTVLESTDLVPLANLKMLILQDLSIETIEDNALATLPLLELLNLANTKITRLTNQTFHGCHNLIELNLDFVRLKLVEPGTFSNLGSLQRLFLSNSNLYGISNLLPKSLNELILKDNFLSDLPQVLTPLDKLQKLDLCGNTFKQFLAHNFKAPNLGYLCLGDQIEIIDKNDLRGQSVLHTMEVKSKHMTVYGVLQCVSELESLKTLKMYEVKTSESEMADLFQLPTLEHLEIIKVHGTVPDELFLTMPNLKVLDLHQSPELAAAILSSDAVLEALQNLTTLRLQNTDTRQLQEKHLTKLKNLKKINLLSNPIHCDCQLKWLVERVLDMHLEIEHPSQTLCNTPSHLYSLPLTNDEVLKEICISINQSRSSKSFDFSDDSNETENGYTNGQRRKDDDGINLHHVMYGIIALGVLILILIIIVILTLCLPKWRKKRKRDKHNRHHRNSLELLPHRNNCYDKFVVPYDESKQPPNPPVRCTSTFKRRTSEDTRF